MIFREARVPQRNRLQELFRYMEQKMRGFVEDATLNWSRTWFVIVWLSTEIPAASTSMSLICSSSLYTRGANRVICFLPILADVAQCREKPHWTAEGQHPRSARALTPLRSFLPPMGASSI